MIKREEMLRLLCKTYPGFRNKIVENVDDWITDDGELMIYPWMSQLCDLVVGRLSEGDYGDADELFSLVERLITEGDEEVSTAIAVGFLEYMQHQTQLEPNYWIPLLGTKSAAHCEAMNRFYGIKE